MRLVPPLLSLLLLAACSSSAGDTASTGGTGGSGRTGSGSTGSSGSGSGNASSGGSSGSACSDSLPEYTNGNGSVTYYTFPSSGAAVNCGFAVTGTSPDTVAFVDTGNGQYFGAMNTADYDDAATCGACVEITRDGSRTVTVTIVDQCPSSSNAPCKSGHIDLSEQAFLQIGTASEGYLGTGNGGAVGVISWKYVACPVTGDVSYALKDPTNMYWNQILVEGHRYAISAVDVLVSGQWVSAVRQSYNYWQAGNGDMGNPPYSIRITDINGDVIEAQLDLVAGDQASSQQFPVCR